MRQTYIKINSLCVSVTASCVTFDYDRPKHRQYHHHHHHHRRRRRHEPQQQQQMVFVIV